MRGLLTSASEELLDVPLYYNLHTMCKSLRVTPPANSVIKSAIINAGQLPSKLPQLQAAFLHFQGLSKSSGQ